MNPPPLRQLWKMLSGNPSEAQAAEGMVRAEPPRAWAGLHGTRLALGRLASTGIDERATARSSLDSTRRIWASN